MAYAVNRRDPSIPLRFTRGDSSAVMLSGGREPEVETSRLAETFSREKNAPSVRSQRRTKHRVQASARRGCGLPARSAEKTSLSEGIKNGAPESDTPSVELNYQDSNLERQNQNLLCYHYTMGQWNGAKIIIFPDNQKSPVQLSFNATFCVGYRAPAISSATSAGTPFAAVASMYLTFPTAGFTGSTR